MPAYRLTYEEVDRSKPAVMTVFEAVNHEREHTKNEIFDAANDMEAKNKADKIIRQSDRRPLLLVKIIQRCGEDIK